MLFKQFLVGVSVFLLSLTANAFTKEECNTIAVNIYAAQLVLNHEPASFKQAEKEFTATPAQDMNMSDEVKAKIVEMAKILKPGPDPQMVGQMVFDACTAPRT